MANRPYFRIGGIKPMPRGIPAGKQVIKFANKSNRGVFLSKRDDDISFAKCPVRVSGSFTSVVLAVRTLRRYCIQKCNNYHFHT